MINWSPPNQTENDSVEIPPHREYSQCSSKQNLQLKPLLFCIPPDPQLFFPIHLEDNLPPSYEGLKLDSFKKSVLYGSMFPYCNDYPGLEDGVKVSSGPPPHNFHVVAKTCPRPS